MGCRTFVFAAALLAGGCQEYAIYGQGPGSGAGDAPSLETPRRLDVITQTTIPEVDVLWVVDNSCSMADEQARLRSNFSVFIQFFLNSGLDWHVGVVSTDTAASGHSGKLRSSVDAGGARYLSSEMDPNIVASAFSQMADLGTSGSGTEAGIDAAWLALAGGNADVQATNAGFYREAASLHLITVSDEQDHSTRVSPSEFIDFLNTMKPSAVTPISYSAIVVATPGTCGSAGSLSDEEYGGRYIDVVNAVGGIIESICTPDWAPVLEQLGLQAAGLKTEYFLTELPVPETIDVEVQDGRKTYHGIDLDRKPAEPTLKQYCTHLEHNNCFGFTYDSRRNSIVMDDFLPSPLATVEIDYELLSGFEDPAAKGEDTGKE